MTKYSNRGNTFLEIPAKLSSCKIFQKGFLAKLSQSKQNLVKYYQSAKLSDSPLIAYFSSI